MRTTNNIQDKQLPVLAQLYFNLSDESKLEFFRLINETKDQDDDFSGSLSVLGISRFLQVLKYVEGRPNACPFCGGKHVVKNGTKADSQRYICRICGKTFGDTENSILKSTKKDLEVWNQFIRCMIDKFSLRKTAQICGINPKTAFIWRHKILDALQNMMAEVRLNGIVEVDETYTPISYKGPRGDTLPRDPRKRGKSIVRNGERGKKRGISDEQVCIPCGINLQGQSIAKISNLGHPTVNDLDNVLGGRIEQGSVVVTDSLHGYSRLSEQMNVIHIKIDSGQFSNGVFNIQKVNSYHSQLKRMINYTFRGISTKYLNNYIVYNNLVNYSLGTESQKMSIMRDFTFSTPCTRTYKDIPNRPLIPMLR